MGIEGDNKGLQSALFSKGTQMIKQELMALVYPVEESYRRNPTHSLIHSSV